MRTWGGRQEIDDDLRIRVLQLLAIEDITQTAVAIRLGISKAAVRAIKVKATEKEPLPNGAEGILLHR